MLDDALGGGKGQASTAATSAATVASRAVALRSSATQTETAEAASSTTEAAASATAATTTAKTAADSGSSAQAGERGLTTATGAPLIVPSTQNAPAGCYNGPAAQNPYYVSVNNPYAAGDVVGYNNWFQTIAIGNLDPTSSAVDYDVDPRFSANLVGGQEALRIVQQFVPGATLVSHEWPGQLPNQPPSYDVKLPNGVTLDGGLILSNYYHDGWGVNEGSDLMMEDACGLPETNSTSAA